MYRVSFGPRKWFSELEIVCVFYLLSPSLSVSIPSLCPSSFTSYSHMNLYEVEKEKLFFSAWKKLDLQFTAQSIIKHVKEFIVIFFFLLKSK